MMLARGAAAVGRRSSRASIRELSPKVLDLAARRAHRQGRRHLPLRAPPNDGGPPLPAIFVGKELAKKLKAQDRRRVRVVSPQDRSRSVGAGTPGGAAPSMREFRMAGIFYTGFDEYDRAPRLRERSTTRRLLRAAATWSPAWRSSSTTSTAPPRSRDELDDDARRPALPRDRLGGAQPQPLHRAQACRRWRS